MGHNAERFRNDCSWHHHATFALLAGNGACICFRNNVSLALSFPISQSDNSRHNKIAESLSPGKKTGERLEFGISI